MFNVNQLILNILHIIPGVPKKCTPPYAYLLEGQTAIYCVLGRIGVSGLATYLRCLYMLDPNFKPVISKFIPCPALPSDLFSPNSSNRSVSAETKASYQRDRRYSSGA